MGMREIPLLLLLPQGEFLEKFFIAAFKARSLIVAFNFPLVISRLACSASTARDRFGGGSSFLLWQYEDRKGRCRENRHRPRVVS